MLYFFYPRCEYFFFVFFFPENCLNFTHSFVSNLVFFSGTRKKNTILTHSLDFGLSFHKSKLFLEIKKIRSLCSWATKKLVSNRETRTLDYIVRFIKIPDRNVFLLYPISMLTFKWNLIFSPKIFFCLNSEKYRYYFILAKKT
jgi:hypothetical protein